MKDATTVKPQPEDQPPNQRQEDDALDSGKLHWWKNWKVMVPIWGLMTVFIWLGIHFGIDVKVIAGGVFLFGLLSNAFAWLLGIIAIVPVIGPLLVKVLSIGFIWLLNAIGYFVSFVAIRRGYSKDVLTYRGLTVALIVGIVIGYVLGKLI
ncbi:hypothetical protein [Desulfopila sp. IMCC35006]|uniref:hypothetical protein n=1 Tax=Desulfopila sp. IMCC35006 TaxID=2569542 RepID=UPI00197AB1A8|nr:hypothetical protein [Desulfopila sp. IMCC35006]